MSVNKIKTLLAITNTYLFNEKDIYNFRQKFQTPEQMFTHLPKWTLNEKYDTIIEAEYFLQFVGQSNDDYPNEEFYFFDLEAIDPMLLEEIDNSGYDNLLNNTKYNDIERPEWIKILKKFKWENYNDFSKHFISKNYYILVNLEYVCSGDWYQECDMYTSITEYFDENFNLKKFEDE
jgi:hypothetical protein